MFLSLLPKDESLGLAGPTRLAMILGFVALSLLDPRPVDARVLGDPGAHITVNSTVDLLVVWELGQPRPCTLRDAIEAANSNLVVGGCVSGRPGGPKLIASNPLDVDYVDEIVFDLGPGTPRIQLDAPLPEITEAVRIDGATGGATQVEIVGSLIGSHIVGAPVLAHGFVVTGSFSSLENLVINGFSGNGILLTRVDGDGIVIVTPPKPDRGLPGSPDPCDDVFVPGGSDDCSPPTPTTILRA